MKFNPIAQSSLAVLSLLLVAPVQSFAAAAAPAPFCINVHVSFDNSPGTIFVARNFLMPDASKCSPWAGYAKTATTVILTSNGTACVSSDSLAMTVSLTSQDPDYVGIGSQEVDYIRMARATKTESFTGSEAGYIPQVAEQISCSSDLLTLPATHD